MEEEAGTVPLSGVVLAGGRGLRLGADKTVVEVAGQTLLGRVIGALRQVVDEIVVVLATLEPAPAVPEGTVVRFVADAFPGRGSLGGVYTGVAAARSFHSLVVACDMPFLSVALLRYMRRRAAGVDVLVPRWGEVLEPLHTIYSKNCLAPMAELLARGHLRIVDFFPAVRTAYVEPAEIDGFDPLRRTFFNVNTPEDLAQARAYAEQENARA